MPTPEHFKATFYSQGYYHIVFRSIDGLNLFQTRENYNFFLQRFSHFLHPFCNCLAYCLLDNHVHFIIHVNSRVSIIDFIISISEEARTVSMKNFINKPDIENITDELLERQVSSFMTSYANAFNKKLSRKGSLFQSPFRRVEIKEEGHLQQAIIYTHANAQKHGLIKDFKEYAYSSYWDILNNNATNVQVKEVLQFFGGKDEFVKTHQMQIDHFYNKGWPSSKLE